MPPRVAKHPRAYIALAVIVAAALLYLGGLATSKIRLLVRGSEIVREPVSFGFRLNRVSAVRPEAQAAGIRFGDMALEIEGRPITGALVVGEVANQRRPGDIVRMKIQTPDGGQRVVNVKLAMFRDEPATALSWLLAITLHVLFPLFCLALGVLVVAVRPVDRNAWLLLATMISFPLMTAEFSWNWPATTVALAWRLAFGTLEPFWMLLFAVYFPERLSWEKRHGWVKWVLLVPLFATAAVVGGFQVVRLANFDLAAPLVRVVPFAYALHLVLGMFAVGSYFMLLGWKSGTASTPDARRRLRLLWMGSGAAVTPLFIAVLTAVVRQGEVFANYPEWAVLVTLLALPLFPLTYAYVIIVNRAMDVGVVLRLGAQYALARGGLSVLRGLVLVAAMWSVWTLARAPVVRNVDLLRVAATITVLLVLRERFSEHLSRWLDRRFFREAYRAEQVLGELSLEVRKFVDVSPLVDTVVRRLSQTLHVPQVAVLLRGEAGFYVVEATVEIPRASILTDAVSVRRVAEKNEPAFAYFDDPESWIHQAESAEKQTLEPLNARLLLPISGRDQLEGMIVLGPKLSEEPFTGTDVQLLQSVAVQTGLAIENSRLVDRVAKEAVQRERANRELEIAREVQERLYPQTYPPVPGLDYAGYCRPAHSVGGDYYDFLAHSGNRFGIAVGDISGKGISAALLMASLQASLRGQAMAGIQSLATMLGNINKLVYGSSAANRYATFFYGEYDPTSRRLVYVNAGHNTPMVLRGDEVIRLEVGGPVVGLLQIASYRQGSMEMQPGDLLFGFSDGISEAMNSDDEDWGEERLLSTLWECGGGTPSEIIAEVMKGADAFAAGAPQHDDMTAIVVKFVA